MKSKIRTLSKLSSWVVAKCFLTIFLSVSVLTSANAAFFYYSQVKNNRGVIETNEIYNVELQVKGIESLLNSSISDLMLLDLRLPDEDRISILSLFRENCSEIETIVITYF